VNRKQLSEIHICRNYYSIFLASHSEHLDILGTLTTDVAKVNGVVPRGTQSLCHLWRKCIVNEEFQ
jgi:hypothetical protein